MTSLLHGVSATSAINLHLCGYLEHEEVLAVRATAKGLITTSVLEHYSRRWLLRVGLFEDRAIMEVAGENASARKRLHTANALFIQMFGGFCDLTTTDPLGQRWQKICTKLWACREAINGGVYSQVTSATYCLARLALEARIPADSATLQELIVRNKHGLSPTQLVPFFGLGGADLTPESISMLLHHMMRLPTQTPQDIQALCHLVAGDAPYRRNKAVVNRWSTCFFAVETLNQQSNSTIAMRFYRALHRGGMSPTKLLFRTVEIGRHAISVIPTLFAWGAQTVVTAETEPYADPFADQEKAIAMDLDMLDFNYARICINTSIFTTWSAHSKDRSGKRADPEVYKLLRVAGATPTIDDLHRALQRDGLFTEIETYLRDGVKPDARSYKLAMKHVASAQILTLFGATLSGRTN